MRRISGFKKVPLVALASASIILATAPFTHPVNAQSNAPYQGGLSTASCASPPFGSSRIGLQVNEIAGGSSY